MDRNESLGLTQSGQKGEVINDEGSRSENGCAASYEAQADEAAADQAAAYAYAAQAAAAYARHC
jgi:hypothetical protein